MNYMKNTINLITKFFDEGDWKYQRLKRENDDVVFKANISMGSILGYLKLHVIVRKNDYIVNATLNNTAEKEAYPRITEYLHRANYSMSNGNFEFDYEDGEITYKTYVNFDGGVNLSEQVIEDSIIIPILMFDKYGKNLLRLMLESGDPKQLIEDAEQHFLKERIEKALSSEDTTSSP